MKLSLKRILLITLSFTIMFWIYFLQNNFSKTNSYDPNWVYWDDSLDISKLIYDILWDKNFYLTMKLTAWRLKLAESSRTNTDKFLTKENTTKFVKDFLWIAPEFQQFHDSIANSILYNNWISDSVKSKYADIMYNLLIENKETLDESVTEKWQLFKKRFSQEFENCKIQYPLSEKMWKVYWALWIFEKTTTKNDNSAYCNFLYAWYWTDLVWWYESMIIATRWMNIKVNDEYLLSFGRRLKEYYVDKIMKKYKWNKVDNWYVLNDNEELNKIIMWINKIILNEKNSNILTNIVWTK